jgi:hypothetical protein
MRHNTRRKGFKRRSTRRRGGFANAKYVVPKDDQYMAGNKLKFLLRIPPEAKLVEISGPSGVPEYGQMELRDLELTYKHLRGYDAETLTAIIRYILKKQPARGMKGLVNQILENMELEK